MKRLAHFLLLVLLVLAVRTPAQEGKKTEDGTPASAPSVPVVEEEKVPETAAAALELQKTIQAKVDAIPETSVENKDIRAAYVAQVQKLSELAKELGRLETVDARRDELLKKKVEAEDRNRKTPDVPVPNYDSPRRPGMLDGKIPTSQIQSDFDEAKLKVEQFQRDFDEAKRSHELLRKDSDLSPQIATLTATIAQKKDEETKADDALRQGRLTGADVPLLEQQLFRARLERAVNVQRRAVLEKEQLVGKPQLEEDIAAAEEAFQRRMLDQWKERRDAIAAVLALRKDNNAKSALELARDERDKYLKKGPGEKDPKSDPRYMFEDLRVAALKADQDRATLQTEESERTSRLAAIGDQALLKAEADDLAKMIESARDGEDDGDLPDSYARLDELRTQSHSRLENAREASRRLREAAISVRLAQKASKREKDQIGTRVRLVRADARNPEKLPENPYTEQDWVDLEAQLNKSYADLLTELKKQSESIDTLRQGWESVRDVAESNIAFIEGKLRWTREESHISFASIKSAIQDAVDAVKNLPERTKVAWGVVAGYLEVKAHHTRVGIVVAVFLVLGFFLWRLRRRLPRTYVWIDQQSKGGSQFFKVLGIYLRRTDVGLLIALFLVGGPLAAGMGPLVIYTCVCLFTAPFLFQLGRATLDIFFSPGGNELRFLDMEEPLAVLLHRAGGWMLNLALFFLPIGYLMTLHGYDDRNPGFVELWWLVFGALGQVVLLLSIFRPIVVRTLIRGQNIVAVSLKASILLGYPLVVGGTLYLFLLGSLRYEQAQAYFQRIILESLAVLLTSYILYRVTLRAALRGREVDPRLNIDDFESETAYIEAGRKSLVVEFLRLFIRIAFLVPVLIILSGFWEDVSFAWTTAGLTGADGLSLLDIFEAVFVVFVTTKLVARLRNVLNFAILPQTKLDRGLRYTVQMLTTYGLWTIGTVIALQLVQVRGEHIAYFTGALAFGIGFGLQSIVKNFVSGLILLVERPVKIGDMVEVEGRSGVVEKITLRATTVMSYDGIGVVIPNELMIGGSITNYSLGHPRLRSTLAVGVAYGTDIQRVRKILNEVVVSHGLILKRPEPECFFIGFGDSSLDFQVLFWTNITTHRPRTLSDLRFAIDAAFRREKIEIPFPQRDLNIRTVDGAVVAAFGGAALPRAGDGGALDALSAKKSDQSESSPKSSS